MKTVFKYTFVLLVLLPVVFFGLAELMLVTLELDAPVVTEVVLTENTVVETEGVRTFENSWYKKNDAGIWEAYLEGEAYRRGRTFGILAKEQIVSQEEAFISQIRKLVPSEWFLNTLKYGVVFFNRDLPGHIPLEFQKEIYGVSKSFSDEYDFVGEKYSRILNYHAAHDVGHALQDLSIVGCTSFAVWGEYSQDSSLIIGRNFDFYMGDDFAKDKLVLFVRPDSGYAFASITWAGFMGVVSGMNEHGLTVTLNAAKSQIPDGAKTPISLLAREILQYAKTIEEAYEIARSRETFVSESILIGSANDKAAAIIEKSPGAIGIYKPAINSLTCSNHYQSSVFADDEINKQNIKDSDSEYRFKRMNQLLEDNIPLNPNTSVDILRDQKGVDGAELGMGNPKAINQLLAHHGIVFQPEKKLMWVSANPFQLGEFVCYDLHRIFSDSLSNKADELSVDSLRIEQDDFLDSDQYQQFLRYKELKNQLFSFVALGQEISWSEELEQEFLNANPESYITYMMLGDYYLESGKKTKAAEYYKLSLSKEIASLQEKVKIEQKLEQCH